MQLVREGRGGGGGTILDTTGIFSHETPFFHAPLNAPLRPSQGGAALDVGNAHASGSGDSGFTFVLHVRAVSNGHGLVRPGVPANGAGAGLSRVDMSTCLAAKLLLVSVPTLRPTPYSLYTLRLTPYTLHTTHDTPCMPHQMRHPAPLNPSVTLGSLALHRSRKPKPSTLP